MTKRKPKELHKPSGRPTDYKTSYNLQAEKLCLLGATDKDLADFFEVCEDTINEWKKQYPKFSESLKKGKETADTKVAESLYKRACGYSCKATKFATFEGSISDSLEYIEHYPPDTPAAIFWLKNRQPKKWRDGKNLEVTGKDGQPIETKNINISKLDSEISDHIKGLYE